MDAILTDPHLNSRFAMCILILMDVIVSKLEHAEEIGDGNAEFVKQLEAVQMAPAKTDAMMVEYDEKYSIRIITQNLPILKRTWRRQNVEILC